MRNFIRRYNILIWAGLCVAAACAVYLPALNRAFIFDDAGSIVENDYLKNPKHVMNVLTGRTLTDETVYDGRRPAVLISYFIDKALWGMHPAGWRGTNLLLHIANTLLLLVIFRRLTEADYRMSMCWAGPAALLFAVHPVMVEAVHLPAFREDLLMTLGILGGLLTALYAPWSNNRWHGGWLALMGVSFLLAVFSKESGLIAPLFPLLLWGLYPAFRPLRRHVIEYGVMALLVWLAAAWVLFGQEVQALGGPWNGRSLPWPQNVFTAPWLFARALRLMMVPWGYSADYVVEPVDTLLSARGMSGLLMPAVSIFLVARWRRRPAYRVPCTALALMWLAFLPVSNLIPLLNPLANRYLYLMMAGGAGLIMWAVVRLLRPLQSTTACSSAAAVCCLVPAVLCVVELTYWSNPRTLWERSAQNQPNSSRAQVWLGLFAKEDGRLEGAAARFQKALEKNPRDISALVNRAIMEGQAGRYDRAETYFQQAFDIRPEHAQTWYNYAVLKGAQGEQDAQRAAIEKAIRLNPWKLDYRRAYVSWLLNRRAYAEALTQIDKILELDPGDEELREVRDRLRGVVP